jgi:hypothetical protein
MRRWLIAAWFIPATAINVLIWALIPCEWNQPYQGIMKGSDKCRQ